MEESVLANSENEPRDRGYSQLLSGETLSSFLPPVAGGEILQLIRSSVVGRDSLFKSPYGERHLVHCDHTATGRPLEFIEEFMNEEVLPMYGNTHTTASVCGYQSHLYRFEARQIVGRSVNARNDKDIVIFTGTGATGAMHKLVALLSSSVKEKFRLQEIPKHISGVDTTNSNGVVFIGPYEHHSSILVWRESGYHVVTVTETSEGQIDLEKLKELLLQYQTFELKIGCFSAASNLTGILTPVNEITILLHSYGALAVWDYAAAAPYTVVDMNPLVADPGNGLISDLAYKDAIVLSPHKFPGGPGTPGILIVKKTLISKTVSPTAPGGGTVFWVTDTTHRYLSNVHEREESGTPDILGAIRAGLVFQLKYAVGVSLIQEKENDFVKRARDTLISNPNIVLVGPQVIFLCFIPSVFSF